LFFKRKKVLYYFSYNKLPASRENRRKSFGRQPIGRRWSKTDECDKIRMARRGWHECHVTARARLPDTETKVFTVFDDGRVPEGFFPLACRRQRTHPIQVNRNPVDVNGTLPPNPRLCSPDLPPTTPSRPGRRGDRWTTCCGGHPGQVSAHDPTTDKHLRPRANASTPGRRDKCLRTDLRGKRPHLPPASGFLKAGLIVHTRSESRQQGDTFADRPAEGRTRATIVLERE
jgi:hypothetical protein